MSSGKYSTMIQHRGDSLIGTEITVDSRLCEPPMSVSKRIDAEGVITLQVNTSDSTQLSSASATLSSNSLDQKHRESSFRRLLRARPKSKQGVPKKKLFGASAGARTRVDDRKLDLTERNAVVETNLCDEVLIDRRQKGRRPFFLPSARNVKTAADADASSVTFTGSKGEAIEPVRPVPRHGGQYATAPCIVKPLTQHPCKIGDRVDIVGGEHNGKTGTVVQHIGDRVHIFVDFKNETWSMPLENVQPHVFIPGHTAQKQMCCQIPVFFVTTELRGESTATTE